MDCHCLSSTYQFLFQGQPAFLFIVFYDFMSVSSPFYSIVQCMLVLEQAFCTLSFFLSVVRLIKKLFFLRGGKWGWNDGLYAQKGRKVKFWAALSQDLIEDIAQYVLIDSCDST